MSESFRTECCICHAPLSGDPAATRVSSGLGPCCWAAYRLREGLRAKPFPTPLQVREPAKVLAFPAWTLSLSACRYPEEREKHSGNYVTVEE